MLEVEERSGVRLVRLAHGKVNALDLELLQALIGTFGDTRPDQAIVLTGAGRAFSAGVELRRIVDGGTEYAAEYLDALSAAFLAVFDHPAPVVAAINGAAIAGGCVLAAACDRRLIARGPVGLAELAVGVPFPTSAIEIVRSVVDARAAGLVLSARNLDPEEARAIGLVDELVPETELVDTAIDRAAALAALPAGVFPHTKRQLQGPARERIAARAAEDDRRMAELWATPAVRAAIGSYLQRLGAARG